MINPRDSQGLVPAVDAAAQGVKVIVMDSTLDPSAIHHAGAVVEHPQRPARRPLDRRTDQGRGLEDRAAFRRPGQRGRTGAPARRARGPAGRPVGEHRHREFEIVAQGWGLWDNEGGLNAMEDILVAHPDVNVVLGENDSMVRARATRFRPPPRPTRCSSRRRTGRRRRSS